MQSGPTPLAEPQTPEWTEPLLGGEEGWLEKPIAEGIEGEQCELVCSREPVCSTGAVSLEHRSNLPPFLDCEELLP